MYVCKLTEFYKHTAINLHNITILHDNHFERNQKTQNFSWYIVCWNMKTYFPVMYAMIRCIDFSHICLLYRRWTTEDYDGNRGGWRQSASSSLRIVSRLFFLIRLKWSQSSEYFQYVGIDYGNVGYEIRKGTKHSIFGSRLNYCKMKYMYPL